MTRRILILGPSLYSLALHQALIDRFDGEVILPEPGRVATEATFELDGDTSAIVSMILEHAELFEPEPVPTFTLLPRAPKPYGKKARRALRGGNHD